MTDLSSNKPQHIRESIRVLQECIELQSRKGVDYQNSASRVKQADYYPNGVLTLLDIIHAKKLRMESVISAILNDPNYKPNYESIEDSAKLPNAQGCRCSSAEVDRVDRSQPILPAILTKLYLCADCRDVTLGQFCLVTPGREVTVVAPRRTKGYMKIDTSGKSHRIGV